MSDRVKRLGMTATLLVGVLLVGGCNKEDSPVGPPALSSRTPVTTPYLFSEQLDRNSAEDRDSRLIVVAYASEDHPAIPQAPFPVLYLLHDYLGDAGYFERYALQTVVDEMYQNGEIGRMLIVTVDASNYFGGSYYRNSGTTGDYEGMVDATIEYVESVYRTHTRGGRNARAMSGQGMGGYGAFRYALDHPELMGAISSMSGPLSFGDPSAKTGFWSEDNGIVATIFEQNGTGPGDPSLYSKLRQGASIYNDTRNFFAMASAFSAHPLRVFDSLGVKYVPKFPFVGKYDTLFNYEWYSGRPAGTNTVSFVSQVDTFGVGVDLPFDANGNLTESIWALWRDSADVNTVFKRMRQQNPTLWSDLDIYMDVGVENQHGYLEQNRDFHTTLTQAGVEHIYQEYEGSGSVPAGHSDLLLPRLREILKFHSERFERPAGPSPQ